MPSITLNRIPDSPETNPATMAGSMMNSPAKMRTATAMVHPI